MGALALALGLAAAHGAVLAGAEAPVSAPDPAPEPAADKPSWSFGGFGTLGAVHSGERGADFTSTILKPNGAGHTRRWSGDVDSRLGVQLDIAPGQRWSAVLQVVSEQGLDNNYSPIVEWANVKYQATPDLALRAGRIALPLFLVADHRKVGYAIPWARPPIELYNLVPISNSDGVDLAYRWQSGAVKHVTQAFYGRSVVKLWDGASAKARGLAGIANTATVGAATLRASVFSSSLTIDILRPMFDAFRQFGPQGAALAERFDVDPKRATAWSAGASYDPGRWFVMGEFGSMNTDSYFGDRTSMYASAGYRLRDFTPYLSYARTRVHSATRDDGLNLAGLAPPLAAAGAALNAGLNAALIAVPVQSNITAGLRWDFSPNYALKLQLERITPRGGSPGTLVNTQPGFRSGRPFHVASVLLDFVF
ncbi:porin [Massilia glaciei]|uniref:Porin n=2 Tax=Massilia glaciei TaxID=1524097 RepID=A0A2U2HM97_9BURK|nr:porin [Massilia glaciei]